MCLCTPCGNDFFFTKKKKKSLIQKNSDEVMSINLFGDTTDGSSGSSTEAVTEDVLVSALAAAQTDMVRCSEETVPGTIPMFGTQQKSLKRSRISMDDQNRVAVTTDGGVFSLPGEGPPPGKKQCIQFEDGVGVFQDFGVFDTVTTPVLAGPLMGTIDVKNALDLNCHDLAGVKNLDVMGVVTNGPQNAVVFGSPIQALTIQAPTTTAGLRMQSDVLMNSNSIKDAGCVTTTTLSVSEIIDGGPLSQNILQIKADGPLSLVSELVQTNIQPEMRMGLLPDQATQPTITDIHVFQASAFGDGKDPATAAPNGYYELKDNAAYIIHGHVRIERGLRFGSNCSVSGSSPSAVLQMDETKDFPALPIEISSRETNVYISDLTIIGGGGHFGPSVGLFDCVDTTKSRRFKVHNCNIIAPKKVGTVDGFGTINITNNLINGGRNRPVTGDPDPSIDLTTESGFVVQGSRSVEFEQNKVVLFQGIAPNGAVNDGAMLSFGPGAIAVVAVIGNIFHPRGNEIALSFSPDLRVGQGIVANNAMIKDDTVVDAQFAYIDGAVTNSYTSPNISSITFSGNAGMEDSEPQAAVTLEVVPTPTTGQTMGVTSTYRPLAFQNSDVRSIRPCKRIGIVACVVSLSSGPRITQVGDVLEITEWVYRGLENNTFDGSDPIDQGTRKRVTGKYLLADILYDQDVGSLNFQRVVLTEFDAPEEGYILGNVGSPVQDIDTLPENSLQRERVCRVLRGGVSVGTVVDLLLGDGFGATGSTTSPVGQRVCEMFYLDKTPKFMNAITTVTWAAEAKDKVLDFTYGVNGVAIESSSVQTASFKDDKTYTTSLHLGRVFKYGDKIQVFWRGETQTSIKRLYMSIN